MSVTTEFRSQHGFDVGSVIEYQPFGGGVRRVRVEAVDFNIKNGRPGFDGTLLFVIGADAGAECGVVWGYCDQVTRVIS